MFVAPADSLILCNPGKEEYEVLQEAMQQLCSVCTVAFDKVVVVHQKTTMDDQKSLDLVLMDEYYSTRPDANHEQLYKDQ